MNRRAEELVQEGTRMLKALSCSLYPVGDLRSELAAADSNCSNTLGAFAVRCAFDVSAVRTGCAVVRFRVVSMSIMLLMACLGSFGCGVRAAKHRSGPGLSGNRHGQQANQQSREGRHLQTISHTGDREI